MFAASEQIDLSWVIPHLEASAAERQTALDEDLSSASEQVPEMDDVRVNLSTASERDTAHARYSLKRSSFHGSASLL